jgi:hypothetical protein
MQQPGREMAQCPRSPIARCAEFLVPRDCEAPARENQLAERYFEGRRQCCPSVSDSRAARRCIAAPS